MIKIKNYINGELIEPISGNYLDNVNPATGKIYSYVADSDAQDVKLAIKAASDAFTSWSTTSTEERSNIIRKIANKIKENFDYLAEAECIDNGKPISLTKTVDIPRAYKNLEFFADGITHFSSDCFVTDDKAINYVTRKPLGVVVTISPWNLPIYLLTWKIAPALITGNTVIAKPSEVTPMTAYILSELCIEAGLPKGVLNIIHGKGEKLGETLSTSKEIKAVSFTGSTKTGRTISKLASEHFKKISLEMGGKNATIVFDDCDFKKTINVAIQASFANQGQICLCGSRIFVQENIYEKFKNEFIKNASKLKIGNPLNTETQQGAVVSKEHYNKIISYIKLAKEQGGTLLLGGEAMKLTGENKDGFFIKPTLFENIPYDSKVNQDEIFGPFSTLIPFKEEKEVIDKVNSTCYGLSGSIWTQDVTKAHRVANAIDSGIIWINTWLFRDLRIPFGGMKDSGVGREGGFDSLKFFTEPKNICVKIK